MLLTEVAQLFKKNKIDFVIVGGYAVALHGAVRGTVDVDLALALNEKTFSLAEKLLNEIGLQSRLPLKAKEVFHFREEYAKNRNLLAWSFCDAQNPIRQLDILILWDSKQIKKSIKKVNGIEVPIASIEDLIKMKKIAGRPQDLEDIRALERLKK